MLTAARGGILNGARRPYLGQVATRCFVHNSNLISATGWNGRTGQYARDNITNPQIVIGNWWAHPTVGDEGLGGTLTLTASIEYPAGTYTPAKFGGSTSVVVADGGQAITDPIPVFIPKGALFFTKRYSIAGNAFGFCGAADPQQNLALGDMSNNSNTDETLTSSTDAGFNAFIPPLAIVAQTRLPSIGIIGDSRIIGTGDTSVDATGDTGYCRLFGDQFAYTSMAAAGDTLSAIVTNSPKRLAILDTYTTHHWVSAGLNDFVAGSTGAAVLAFLNTFLAGRPNYSRIITNDHAPATTSTDSWATTGNQTATAFEANRVAYNSGVLALQGLNQILRIETLEKASGSAFAWIVNGGANFATADGTHETTAQLIRLKANNPFTASMVR